MTTFDQATGAPDHAIENIYPLTALQEGMLFHTRLAPGSGEYWAQSGVLFKGDLDLRALWRAWELVFTRHEVLRTTVVWDRLPRPLSVVSRSVPLPLRMIDLSGLDEAAQQAVIARYAAADRALGADFDAPTPVRIAVIRLGGRTCQMMWSYHHLLLDGWSVQIVLGEVLEAYHAFRAGREPELAVRRPFSDFVAWVARQDMEEAKAYWRERLAGLTAPAPLGVERVTGQTGQDTRPVRLPVGVSGELREFARTHRLTVNTVVLGASAVLMALYSGANDVVFGVTSSGRGGQIDGIDGTVGLLINTTPARVRVDRDAPMVDWLVGLQDEQVRARRFEHTPLVTIAACSDGPPGQPLFTTHFVFENYPTETLEEAEIRTSATGLRIERNLSSMRVDQQLAVIVGFAPDLTIRLRYDRSRFDAATIERMAGQLAVLLQAVAKDPGQRVGELSLLTDAERAQLVYGWNDTAAPMPAVGGVHELIVARADASPDVVALVSGGRWLSYGGLMERADRLAGRLRTSGVGAETVVGLGLPRGAGMVVAMVAVWRAGGAYVPLDPDYPAERLAFMRADSGASVVLRDLDLELDLDRDLDLELEPAALPAPAAVTEPDQLAYMIYTSGSTGRPKGVQVSHGAVVNMAVALGPALGAEAGRMVLQFASFSFDAAVLDVAAVLAGGATLAVATAQERAEPGRLVAMIRGLGVGSASVVPSLLGALDPDELAGVRRLLVGAELLPEPVAKAWGRGRLLVNTYGPTEATVMVTTVAVDPDAAGLPPIGSPVANMRVLVLDQRMNPVPVGVAGELFIGGAQLARGYGGRPVLTAERFVADPFAADGSRMYRSGDRVRWRADGQLEFVGRVDEQLKVRGFRVEPGEIEAILAAHPGVRSAVVAAFGEEGDRRLVAYVVPVDGVPQVAELRDYLLRSLPEFMVPAVFIELAELPLTPNGKIDRAALPNPDAARPDVGGYAAPVGATAELLAGIWAQVLGVDLVGADDNFFELGGHSLLATQVVSRVRDVFGVEIPLSVLFDQRTVRRLASAIDGAQGVPATPMTRADKDQALPLSFAQQRLWFLDRLEPGSAEYNVPSPVRWSGALDVAELGAALAALVRRHEVLRTRLVADADGVAYQVIDPPGAVPLPVADVSGEADPAAAARRLVGQDAAAPFDLEGGPLIRALLIRLAADEHVLAVTLHHVVCDEWSGRIMRRELSAFYAAFRAGGPDPLPPLPVQYADFAVWQREWVAGEILDGQLAYWRQQLAGLPVLELPTDRPRLPIRSTAGALSTFVIPGEVAERLRVLARERGVTMFMTLLGAFAALLGRYGGTDDVVVGTPVANRNRAEIEGLIGFFVNTLVLRTDLSGDPAFSELLGRVRETALAAYAHQDVPFEQLVDALVTERDRSRTPLFQVLFTYTAGDSGEPGGAGQPGGSGEPGGAGEQGDRHDVRRDTLPVKFDVSVTLRERSDGALAGAIQYSTALFDAVTVERMAGQLAVLLQGIATDAGRRVGDLPVLTDAERHRLVDEWNDTAVAALPVAGVHELITARAELCPDAIAVVAGGASVSYGDLAERANRLGHYLRGRGVGPESVVGVCLDRGIDMVVALLAAWQAGGAYLPLDPGYPAERLAFMLADSGASPVIGAAGVDLDDPDVRAVLSALPVTPPDGTTVPDQLAYVLYTSGSTGRPKGVHVPHRGLVNRLAWMQDAYDLKPGERVLHKTPSTFDVSLWELLWPLTVGSCLVLAEPGRQGDVDYLVECIAQQGVNVTHFVPSLFHQFVSSEWAAPMRDLRLVVCSGEALAGDDVARFYARHPDARVENLYGPTEASIDVSYWSCERPGGGTPPIGAPIANTALYVLDRSLRPVPVGVAGELFIGGVQLARGYAGRPALTAERFVADPFAPGGGRLYRSGDRARWRADGQVEYLGRLDHQVKIRGFRIETGEVEAVLTAHQEVRSAVVVAFGPEDNRRLAAYLVPADPAVGIPAVAQLREHLRSRVPEFMVPALFTELAELPLMPNGKIDRAALPAPDGVRPGDYVAPASPTEELLAGIWVQLLGVDRVGAADDFFELGGHSLLATQVISRIRRVFAVELPLAALFDQPTVRELSRVIEDRILDEVEHMSDGEVLQTLNTYHHDTSHHTSHDTKPDQDGAFS